MIHTTRSYSNLCYGAFRVWKLPTILARAETKEDTPEETGYTAKYYPAFGGYHGEHHDRNKRPKRQTR